MPNKDEFLQSIQPGMKLDKAFFLKVYGYEISYPGFSETAIKALEDAGCSKAREYYEQITTEYEKKRDESIRPVAHAFRLKCEQEWERKVKEYERKKGDELRKQETTQNLTKDELTELCKKLLQDGVITSPEQFVMLVSQDQ